MLRRHGEDYRLEHGCYSSFFNVNQMCINLCYDTTALTHDGADEHSGYCSWPDHSPLPPLPTLSPQRTARAKDFALLMLWPRLVARPRLAGMREII